MASNGPGGGVGGEWIRLEQESMAPSPRFGASLTTCGTEILLFGGCQEYSSGSMCYFSDLYRLALRLTADSELSYNWELVPATGHAPAPRESHCACYIKGTMECVRCTFFNHFPSTSVVRRTLHFRRNGLNRFRQLFQWEADPLILSCLEGMVRVGSSWIDA